jgi:hypothetical protein
MGERPGKRGKKRAKEDQSMVCAHTHTHTCTHTHIYINEDSIMKPSNAVCKRGKEEEK